MITNDDFQKAVDILRRIAKYILDIKSTET